MKKSIQHHSHCPRKTITPNLNGKVIQAEILCDFCWDEYNFCWSEHCIHEWYDILITDSRQTAKKQGENGRSLPSDSY
jgi:hypothetical protein